MFAHDPASNGETQAAPGGMAHVLRWSGMGAGLIDPVEALEEMGQVRGFDARSLVDDLQASVTGLSVQFHLDLFANASTVCDRVFQEIDAELRQVEAISPDHELVQARQVDLDGVSLCQRGEVFRCIDDDLTEIDSFAFEHGLPLIGAGQDQQVTDQPGHALIFLRDDRERLDIFLGGVWSLQNPFRFSPDNAQRGSQFVAGIAVNCRWRSKAPSRRFSIPSNVVANSPISSRCLRLRRRCRSVALISCAVRVMVWTGRVALSASQYPPALENSKTRGVATASILSSCRN